MVKLTQDAFLDALVKKFEATELVELLDLTTTDIVQSFFEEIIAKQRQLEEELKWGH